MHEQQYALFALDAGYAQGGGHAPHAVLELAVAERAVVVDEGQLVRPRGIDSQQVLRDVEALGRCGNGGRWGHEKLLLAATGR